MADVLVVDAPPLSVRHPWQRVSMLATLMVLLALPWLTATGCEGDKPPVTFTGFELFADSVNDDPLFALAPIALFVATLVGILAVRVKGPGRRLLLVLLQLGLVAAGSFFLLLAVELPRASEVVSHHFAGIAGAVALVALVVEALARTVFGVHELWRVRRSDRETWPPNSNFAGLGGRVLNER